jgi:dienelactone hydrolase
VTIFGVLTLPDGDGRGPAVVLTHGCGGISGAQWFWVKRLREIGIATFLVNSFTGRNIPAVCRDGYPISMASTLTDVHRALSLLAAHPQIDAGRIALMGFSFGGGTALWAAHPRFRQRYGPGPLRFTAHLAVYPASCFIKLADEHAIDVPIRIFHGTVDDWTPIGPCRDYVARLRGAGKDAALFEYAGAPHGFDNELWRAGLTLAGIVNFGKCEFVERDGMIVDAQTGKAAGSDAPCMERVASIGPSADAQRQSADDVRTFLKALFRLTE